MLFAEAEDFDDDRIVLLDPFLIKSTPGQTAGSEVIYGTPWIPFTDDTFFTIPLKAIYYVGNLNDAYIKFYGAIVMKYKIALLHEMAMSRIENGEDDISVFTDVMFQIEETSKFHSNKFQIEEIDLAAFKEKLGFGVKEANRILH